MEGATPSFLPLVRHRGVFTGAYSGARSTLPVGGRSLHSDPWRGRRSDWVGCEERWRTPPTAGALPCYAANSAADTRTVVVASRAIEASVMGDGEWSGGGDGGGQGRAPPVGVRRGRSPSPAPMYYIGQAGFPALCVAPCCVSPPSHGGSARRARGNARGAASLRFVASDAGNQCCPASDGAFRESLQPQWRGLRPLREKRCGCHHHVTLRCHSPLLKG